MRVVVTGGAGFVGRHLVKELLSVGHEVSVIDSGESGLVSSLGSSVEITQKDISLLSSSEWLDLLSGASQIFHLAARKYNTPGMTSDKLIAANSTATFNLAQAAAIAGVNKVVYSSSLYAYGQSGASAMKETDVPTPNTVYGASKLFGEHALKCKDLVSPLNVSIARFFFVYGPEQFAEGGYKSVIESNFEKMLSGESPTVRGTGTQSLDYVYVGDVVDGLMRLANDDRQLLVNLSSGRGVSINALTAKMIETSGFTGVPTNVQADWTEGTSRVGSSDLARNLLGWTAQTSIEDGLKAVWESKQKEARR